MDYLGDALRPILVTGSSGFLGGRVLSGLRHEGVTALGVGRSASCDVPCDLRSLSETQALIEQFSGSAVIHCAAATPRASADYRCETPAAESLSMVRNLANVAQGHIVFTSSMTVYPDGTAVAREQDAVVAGSGYAAAKLEAERVLLNRVKGITTILRLPGLFGPPRRAGVLFNAAQALAMAKVPTLDPLLPQWAAMHVDDAADACIRAVLRANPSSVVMNVGYAERMAISEAVKQLAQLFGRELELPAPRWFAFDLSVLHSTLGPVPNVFSERLRELAAWVKDEVAQSKS